jgi:two-component system OmpR family sensor kinase
VSEAGSALLRALRLRVALVLVVLVVVGDVWAAIAAQNARRATLAAQGAATRETVRYVLRDGRTLADAVPDLVDETTRVGLSVQVFDAAGKVLGGNATLAQPDATRGGSPPSSIGLQQIEVVPVSGGYIVIAPAANVLERSFVALVLGSLAAIALAFALFDLLARRAVARAFRRVDRVAGALATLGDGDLARRELVPSADDPADPLAAAYNAAARRIAATVEERAATEERMRRFLSDAGHELRTPLAVINGYLDVLKRGALGEPHAAAKIVETMAEEGDRMTGMLERLLRLARLDTVAPQRPQRIDLGALARDVVEGLRPLAGARALDLELAPETIVEADPSELGEAIRNLLDNAFKYAPRADVRVDVTRDGDSAFVRVSDRGPGMSDDEREHAFERFYRGDSRGEIAGSGLGLSIVKRIVERAGGAVALEARGGGGTCAIVRLPVAPGEGERVPVLTAP